jgi:hypothetical protein
MIGQNHDCMLKTPRPSSRHFASRRRRRLSPPPPRLRANMSLDARSSFVFKAKLAEQAERHDGASAIRVT